MTGNSYEPLGPVSIAGVHDLHVRIAMDGTIVYCNTAMAEALGLDRSEVIGQSSDLIESNFAVTEAVGRVTSDFPVAFVRHHSGVLYRKRETPWGSVRDLVFERVEENSEIVRLVRRYLPESFGPIQDSDLATFEIPERRYMTVLFADLRGFTELSRELPPEGVREMLSAFLEYAIDAIHSEQGCVDKIIGDEIMALFGAPRYYSNHALRAVKAACQLLEKHSELCERRMQENLPMPECGIGLFTGEMVVGKIGGSLRQEYTALGASVNLASRLCGAAGPGEILVTEDTLEAIRGTLPSDWQVVETELDESIGLPGGGGKTEEVLPLSAELERKVICVGEGVEQNVENASLFFAYCGRLRVKGFDNPITVLRVFPGHRAKDLTPLSQPESHLLPGIRIFGKYRLHHEVGRGGMGVVYRASDQFGNSVAIKMLQGDGQTRPHLLRRFQQEAKILSKIPHRNICGIREIGVIEQKPYIAMEFIDGVTLDQFLNRTRPSSLSLSKSAPLSSVVESVVGEPGPDITSTTNIRHPDQAVEIIAAVCDAIHYAHQHGVLHRDIKPGNIMLRCSGEPVVMDFGLAKLERSWEDDSFSQNTLSGVAIGTIDYMAPEQAQSGTNIDPRADVYSIGAVLYRLLCGKPHFQSSGNLFQDAEKLRDWEPAPPSSHLPGLPSDLDTICLKALRAQREERYRSVAALREDLDRYRNNEVLLAKPLSLTEVATKWIRRHRVAFTSMSAAIVAILCVVAASFYLLNQRRIEAELLRNEALAAAAQARANEETAQAIQAELEATLNRLKLSDEERADLQTRLSQIQHANFSPTQPQTSPAEQVHQSLQKDPGKIAEGPKENLFVSPSSSVSGIHQDQPLDPSNLVSAESALQDYLRFLREDNWTSAWKIISRALEKSPENPLLRLAKGRLLIAGFRPTAALSELVLVQNERSSRNLISIIQPFAKLEALDESFHRQDVLKKSLARKLDFLDNVDDVVVASFLEKDQSNVSFEGAPPPPQVPERNLPWFLAQESFWPGSITIHQELVMTIKNNSSTGYVTMPRNSQVKLVGQKDGQLLIELGRVQGSVDPQKTDFLERCQASFAQYLESEKQRIIKMPVRLERRGIPEHPFMTPPHPYLEDYPPDWRNRFRERDRPFFVVPDDQETRFPSRPYPYREDQPPYRQERGDRPYESW